MCVPSCRPNDVDVNGCVKWALGAAEWSVQVKLVQWKYRLLYAEFTKTTSKQKVQLKHDKIYFSYCIY